ncbi:hypothetical protein [Phenylobacterium sp.]|jgi:hypothetical protein|uniref:hypothetical protein n=1 Tax=Phenylobacterium sp. TaxID=1871053 RepID=UPI002E367603|nr:hypothetical protein [Phenylobacterium sp.]HEX3364574.1 hypothetical protein [Phenylobacterium sp.]
MTLTLPEAIFELLHVLRSEIVVGVEVDRPADPAGEWWLDFDLDGMSASVSWSKARGFGLFTREDDVGIGDRPDELFREPQQASLRLLQLAASWKKTAARPPLGLRDVRHLVGESQTAIAASLGMDQAGVSRLEKRDDWKLSTLRDYVAAMGGVLELRVRFPSFEAPLSPAHADRSRRVADHVA